jgi:cell division septal protein FtsQ
MGAVSTSDRRSGSSGASKRRRNVYISTAPKNGDKRTDAVGRQAPARVEHPASDKPGAVRPAAGAPSAARLRAEQRKAQRETRMSAQTRARRFRVGAIAASAVLVLAACIALYNSPLFAIRTVEVVGAQHVPAETVRALARVPADATLIRFPADAVAQRVGADPWIASVSVTRVFPSGMRIRVVERVPVAIVDAGASMWLIDGTGSVIATPSADASGTLPVIRDVPGLDLRAGRRTISEPLLNAIKVLTGISSTLAATVASVSAPTIDGTALTTAGNIEIVVGEAVDLPTKEALAQRILKEHPGKVVSIDVRNTDRSTWRGLK